MSTALVDLKQKMQENHVLREALAEAVDLGDFIRTFEQFNDYGQPVASLADLEALLTKEIDLNIRAERLAQDEMLDVLSMPIRSTNKSSCNESHQSTCTTYKHCCQ